MPAVDAVPLGARTPAVVEDRVAGAMERARMPGVAVAVVVGDEIVYARGFGVTAADSGRPVGPETLFRIGSLTKPLTGTLVMRLVERGVLDLDRPVSAYLPWLELAEPGAAARVTLRMLLSHTSGLASGGEGTGPCDAGAAERYARTVLPRVPMVAPPGVVHSYSNHGVALAGHVAEIAAGAPYAELMREHVFDPLGMVSTTFDPVEAAGRDLAWPHAAGADGAPAADRRAEDNRAYRPAGFAFSSSLDLASFAAMQMNGGRFRGRQVLAANSVAEMQRPHAPAFGPMPGMAYCLTFNSVPRDGSRVVGHGGAGGSGYGARLEMAVERRVAVVVLVNWLPPELPLRQLAYGLLDELLGLPPEARPAPVEPDRSRWPAYTGTYRGIDGRLVAVRATDDGLLLELGGETHAIEALADDHYVGKHSPVTVGFIGGAGGPVEHALLNMSPVRRVAAQAR